MRVFDTLKRTGPGALVAAAFIGPGTMTTMTIAGATFSYSLIWVVIFATLSTIIFQEMAVRLAFGSQLGFASAIRQRFLRTRYFILITILVVTGIFIGNAAYEAGNITGASLYFFEHENKRGNLAKYIIVVIFVVVFGFLYHGKYKLIEKLLISIVILMSVIFISAAISLEPEWEEIVRSIANPHIPVGGFRVAVAVLGTTIVPYNLFLHSTAIKKRNEMYQNSISDLRWDTYLSIGLGGLISLAILLSAAVVFNTSNQMPASFIDLASPFEDLFGTKAALILGIGFLAAGLSSSLTAPLAAAYTTTELLGLEQHEKSWPFRFVWMTVLFVGFGFAFLNTKPIPLILFAQIINGILLPFLAILLVFLVNDTKTMVKYRNNMTQNILSIIVIFVSILLSIKSLVSIF